MCGACRPSAPWGVAARKHAAAGGSAAGSSGVAADARTPHLCGDDAAVHLLFVGQHELVVLVGDLQRGGQRIALSQRLCARARKVGKGGDWGVGMLWEALRCQQAPGVNSTTHTPPSIQQAPRSARRTEQAARDLGGGRVAKQVLDER